MNQQFKKIFSVALALTVGLGIVFFAWKGDSLTGAKISIDTETGNSWKDSLTVVPHGPTALLGTEYAQSGATTTTNFVAQTFVENYARAQVGKGAVPLEDTDIQGIVQTLSEKTRAVDTIKQYSEQDLIVVPVSTSTVATYKEKTSEALSSFAQKNKMNELQIVAQALDSNDASKLAPLGGIVANYQTLVDTLLAVPVPRTVLAFHLSLVQGYANMSAGIADMQEVISDPVRGMRGIAKYNNGTMLVDTAVAMLNAK